MSDNYGDNFSQNNNEDNTVSNLPVNQLGEKKLSEYVDETHNIKLLDIIAVFMMLKNKKILNKMAPYFNDGAITKNVHLDYSKAFDIFQSLNEEYGNVLAEICITFNIEEGELYNYVIKSMKKLGLKIVRNELKLSKPVILNGE